MTAAELGVAILELAGLRREIARLQRSEKQLCKRLRAIAEDRDGEIAPRDCPLRVYLVERGRPRWKQIAVKLAALAFGVKWRKPLADLVAEHTTESRAVTLRPNFTLARKQPDKVVSIARAKGKGAR